MMNVLLFLAPVGVALFLVTVSFLVFGVCFFLFVRSQNQYKPEDSKADPMDDLGDDD